MCRCLIVLFLLLSGATGAALADEAWQAITSPDEVRALIAGQTVVMNRKRQQFYREDGNMVEYFPTDESYAVRKWTVGDDGKICWQMFAQPDETIDCAAIMRSPGATVLYRYQWDDSEGAFGIEFLAAPSEAMIAALNETAGAAE